jgi:hypothetical protein
VRGGAAVQLVYGRQLQQPEDEQPADPLDVSSMTREQRDALKRRIPTSSRSSQARTRRPLVPWDREPRAGVTSRSVV